MVLALDTLAYLTNLAPKKHHLFAVLNYYTISKLRIIIYELFVSDCFVCSEDINYKNKQKHKIIEMTEKTLNIDVEAFTQSLGSWNDSENIGR